MPVKSKEQFRFMQAVASGKAKDKPKGLSKEEAKEMLESTHTPYKQLPKSKDSFSKLKKLMGNK